jgi:hypothetical protein
MRGGSSAREGSGKARPAPAGEWGCVSRGFDLHSVGARRDGLCGSSHAVAVEPGDDWEGSLLVETEVRYLSRPADRIPLPD